MIVNIPKNTKTGTLFYGSRRSKSWLSDGVSKRTKKKLVIEIKDLIKAT